jgi:hypothetical protein
LVQSNEIIDSQTLLQQLPPRIGTYKIERNLPILSHERLSEKATTNG